MADTSEAVAQLVAVSGFEASLVEDALQRFSGDADEALLYLFSDQAVSPATRHASRARPHPAGAHPLPANSEGESEDSEDYEASDYSDNDTSEPQLEALELEVPCWGKLPPDVMHVLGHWLAEHLGKHVERQIAPDYLHPLRSQADLLERGHQRCSATLGMLRAIQACRQTCKIWRDDIPYRKVMHLALDGVAFPCAPARRSSFRPPPKDDRFTSAARAPVLWTWWPGSRVIRPREWYRRNPRPRRTTAWPTEFIQTVYSAVPPNAPVPRCPSCRTICAPRQGDQLEHLALYNYMNTCGLGGWYETIRKVLKVRTIAELRQLTVRDLLTGLAEHYSKQSLSNTAPQFVQKVRATPVQWSEDAIENTACQECNNQPPQHCTHVAEDTWVPGCQAVGLMPSRKTICAECQMLFCCPCAGRIYRDGRPQLPSEILPPDFSARFSNIRVLSLCDLLLPSLPPQLTDCVTLRTLDISGNSLYELPGWLADLTMLQHLDLSEQRRGLRSGPPTLCKDAMLGSWSLPSTLVTLRMKNLGLAVIPLAILDLKRLQILDMSDNMLLCTAEHPVRFSTAGSSLSPNAEYNLSAATWLADRALFPDLRIINLAGSVLQMGEAILVQAQRWAESLQDPAHNFSCFATNQEGLGLALWQHSHLFEARAAAVAVHSLEALAGDHWFQTFLVCGGTLLLKPGDQEVEPSPTQESEPATLLRTLQPSPAVQGSVSDLEPEPQ